MKKLQLLSLALCTMLALDSARAAAPSAPEKDPAPVKPAATDASGPEANLKQGMPAATVRQIMGQPAEVAPMKAPQGKAEIWVYRRNVNVRMDRVPIGSQPITVTTFGSDGKAHEQSIGENVQYGDRYRATEETVQLLMFNDHFLTQKISRREVMHFKN